MPRNPAQNDQSRASPDAKYFSCDGAHVRATCKFREAVCQKCDKKDHIVSVCRAGMKDSRIVGKNASIIT